MLRGRVFTTNDLRARSAVEVLALERCPVDRQDASNAPTGGACKRWGRAVVVIVSGLCVHGRTSKYASAGVCAGGWYCDRVDIAMSRTSGHRPDGNDRRRDRVNRSRVFVVSGSRVVGHGRNMLRLAVFVGCHFHDYVAKKRGTYVRKRVKIF